MPVLPYKELLDNEDYDAICKDLGLELSNDVYKLTYTKCFEKLRLMHRMGYPDIDLHKGNDHLHDKQVYTIKLLKIDELEEIRNAKGKALWCQITKSLVSIPKSMEDEFAEHMGRCAEIAEPGAVDASVNTLLTTVSHVACRSSYDSRKRKVDDLGELTEDEYDTKNIKVIKTTHNSDAIKTKSYDCKTLD
jgi:hypothetical protein